MRVGLGRPIPHRFANHPDARAFSSADYKQVRAVIDKAIGDLKAHGAELPDPVIIPGLKERVTKLYDGDESERALNDYLASLTHPSRLLGAPHTPDFLTHSTTGA